MARSTRTKRSLWITHEVERARNGDAVRNNITAGKSLAATVRTTLGPNGMDKMLVGKDGTVIVTNDGASILGRLAIDDPLAKTLVDVADAQSNVVGDGTTTVILLVGELLSAADSLLERGLHPTTIVEGYREAVERAHEYLDDNGIPIEPTDPLLCDVARTAVTGRWGDRAADSFAELVVSGVRAVESDERIDLRRLGRKTYPGGELRESELVDGLLVDTNTSSTSIETLDADLPRTLTGATIALVDGEVAVEKPTHVDTAAVDGAEQLERIRSYETDRRETFVGSVTDLDIDVLCCQKSIDDAVRNALVRGGVLPIERTRRDEFDSLARATGATTVSSVAVLDATDLGRAGTVERRTVGGAEILVVSDCPGERHASLLVRGGTEHVADESRRIVEDCLSVVERAIRDETVVPGGGAIELALARALSSHAERVEGRPQIAVRAFSKALEGIPRILASNTGTNPRDALVELRNRHHAGERNVGIGSDGRCKDMLDAGIVAPRSVTERCLANALEAAAMVLRIDDTLIVRDERGAHDSDGQGRRGSHRSTGPKESTGGYPWAIGH